MHCSRKILTSLSQKKCVKQLNHNFQDGIRIHPNYSYCSVRASYKNSASNYLHSTVRSYCVNNNDKPDKHRSNFNWKCKHTWREASINTSWCLLGCSIGDFGTMVIGSALFPGFVSTYPFIIMSIATINGLLTSIMLETGILYSRNKQKGMTLQEALSTALGMSLISMISMETAMNITDYAIVGAANVTMYSMIPSLIAGFLVPLPYNYWRLKKYGKACH